MSKTSESIKRKWQDPEYRARQTASRAHASQLRSEAMKKNWADPDFRERTLAGLAKPEVRAKMAVAHSELMTEKWKDPEFRAKESKRRSEFAKSRQGEDHPAFKHGRTRTVEYQAYHQAQARCTNPNHPSWPNYGGRGIRFELTSFEEFLEAVGRRPSPKHSLDRIDVNGPYAIWNLRWALGDVQMANRRPEQRKCYECGQNLRWCVCNEPPCYLTFAIPERVLSAYVGN
jgi:hypothetical protein